MSDNDNNRQEWFKQLEQHRTESDKCWKTALCLSIFLGWLGVDRFYLGYAWLGMLKLCTFGGFFIWWAIDVFLLLAREMKDAEGRALSPAL